MKIMFCFLVFLILSLNKINFIESFSIQEISRFNVPTPGYVNVIPNPNGKNTNLVISSFSLSGPDNVYYLPNYNFENKNPTIQVLNNSEMVWPNDVTYVSESLLKLKNVDPYGGLIVPFGFFLKNKAVGGLSYYPFKDKYRQIVSNNSISLSNDGPIKWFYHRVKYVDVTGDGIEDLVTCRASIFYGPPKFQLVVYTFDASSHSFIEHVINEGYCDVMFSIDDIDGDGTLEVVAASFLTNSLNLIYSKTGNFLDGVDVKLIDNQIGRLFDVRIKDVDEDGVKELIVTNHQERNSPIKSSLFIYDLDGRNLCKDKWKRYVIDDSIENLSFSDGAPGAPILFYPELKRRRHNRRPWIALSGDSSQSVYVFKPEQLKSGKFSYSLYWTKRFNGYSIGYMTFGDVNNDGFNEMIVPIYENNTVVIFGFNRN